MYVHVSNPRAARAAARVVDFPKLSGGLNIRELNYRLENNQSPNMKNLWWQDGVLQCRDGQYRLWADSSLGTGWACEERPFYGAAFFHIGTGLYWADMAEAQARTRPWAEIGFSLNCLCTGVSPNRGSFFRYGDCLYYKNRGGYFRIRHSGGTGTPFAAEDMTDPAQCCTPVTVINADPSSGAGTLYQPENRLSPRKSVRYNAAEGVTVYHLPVTGLAAVVSVTVDGAEKSAGTDYSVDLHSGTVTFAAAPPVCDPPVNNTVEITYSKPDSAALQSVLDCCYAAAAGSGNNICILLGGSLSQPNAVFWNGNDQYGMHPGYFPMTHYNLCGETEDPVTGFGKQYDDLILFQAHSLGKLEFGVESVEGRDSVRFAYQRINARIGCDLPWTIQLIENNLVFCNTHRGVHLLRSASAALENNVCCISDNVNGSLTTGLLADLRRAGTAVSADDDARYWLNVGDHVYLWDYSVSTVEKPSWFYCTAVSASAFFSDDASHLYHLDAAGGVTCFIRSFSDYGEPIDKLYAFPTQYFGSYDRLKDILSLLVVVRSDTDTVVSLRYDTDYERRVDPEPIRSYAWRLCPRNLSHRCLATARYGHVARRTPGCRHVRHFSVTLSNNAAGEDLAIVSAQIYFRYQGKER